ncbi:MAG: hypothetical protein JWQ76_450 [Ramlibacter sp.]|nr:hypothetical protein [Ramlibacter sp.]
MKALRLILAAFVCTTPLLAAAQWVYLDKDGRKVFSDKAPPPEVTHILRQPGVKPGSSVAVESAAAAPVAAVPASARAAGVDKNLEARKKQAEADAAGKKKADEEKVAQLRSDNCSRARGSKADFESGARVLRTNDKGEREVLDDKQREAEMRRIDAVIASDCK